MAASYVDVLAHVVLSSDTTTITISSIPSGYQDMYLIGNFRDSYQSQASFTWARCSLNNSTSNPLSHRSWQTGTSGAYSGANYTGHLLMGSCSRSHVNAGNFFAPTFVSFINQNAANEYNHNWSVWTGAMWNGDSASNQQLAMTRSGYQGTASPQNGEISRIDIWADSGSTLKTGSSVTLYGTKSS